MINQFVYSILLRASVPIFGVVNFMLIVRLFEEEVVGVWVLYMTILALVEVTKNGFWSFVKVTAKDGTVSPK